MRRDSVLGWTAILRGVETEELVVADGRVKEFEVNLPRRNPIKFRFNPTYFGNSETPFACESYKHNLIEFKENLGFDFDIMLVDSPLNFLIALTQCESLITYETPSSEELKAKQFLKKVKSALKRAKLEIGDMT